jgi:hypothetical protein
MNNSVGAGIHRGLCSLPIDRPLVAQYRILKIERIIGFKSQSPE